MRQSEYGLRRHSKKKNDLQELREIWNSWTTRDQATLLLQLRRPTCLLDIKVDKYLFRALAQFGNPAYSCFTPSEESI
ncbi:hypothetical protein CXB51_025988 [Gossypium anomalum]|uniref:Uncharacterized protein n=1 Tax=Gossypium anomalum TaxID=47600 RepID=A0A8J5Z4M3_9ROSI|nr:hypothetical protein CXB51_025988 [Gossypium anomalum]